MEKLESMANVPENKTQQGIHSFLRDQRRHGERHQNRTISGLPHDGLAREKDIVAKLETDLALLARISVTETPGQLDIKWRDLVENEPSRFINRDGTVKLDILRNFRNLAIFIPDVPAGGLSLSNPLALLSGGHRGSRRLLIENYELLKERGYLPFLQKYPASPVGNPNVFYHQGCRYTHRWAKHIYSLGLYKALLENRLSQDFTALDLGSSYGIFSYLLKKEYPNSHHILVDFPEQLTLAHYFLGMNFPDARIATLHDVKDINSFSREDIRRYDFVLLPWFYYPRLQEGSTDLFMNFASFGEMRRDWFDFYVRAKAFHGSRFLFMMNRFCSAPTYDSDLTALDYPFADFRKIHYGIWPFSYYTYNRKHFFFTEKVPFPSQYFEFIGERVRP